MRSSTAIRSAAIALVALGAGCAAAPEPRPHPFPPPPPAPPPIEVAVLQRLARVHAEREALRSQVEQLQAEREQHLVRIASLERRLLEPKRAKEQTRPIEAKPTPAIAGRGPASDAEGWPRVFKMKAEPPEPEPEPVETALAALSPELLLTGPDGAVLFCEEDTRHAWIDLGEQHGLKRGLRFASLREGEDGRRRLTPILVVDEVGHGISRVALVGGQAEQTAIGKGDRIVSPLFDRDDPPHVVVIGRGAEAVRARIAELGALVDDEVGPQTDLVIALDDAQQLAAGQVAEGSRRGVVFLRGEQVAPFLR